MAPTTLETLPPELRLEVVAYIRRPSNLRNLCLTSSTLRASAIPSLYHCINIDLRKCKFPRLNSFFLHSNEGHKYVRELNFRHSVDCKQDLSDVSKMVRLCLELLPRNSLRHTELPDIAIDEESFLALCVTQQSLEKLYFGRMDFDLGTLLQNPAFPANPFTALHTIVLPEKLLRYHDLDIIHYFVERADKLRTLRILPGTVDGNGSDDSSLHDTQNEDGQLTKKLFSHIIPYGKSPPLELEELRLSDQRLSYSDRTFTRCIDFTQLHTLELWECSRSEILLAALTSVFRCSGANLRELDYQGRALPTNVVEDFLDSFCGLRFVTFDYNSLSRSQSHAPLPRVKSLLRHGESLQRLSMSTLKWLSDNQGYILDPMSKAQLQEVVLAFPGLEYLQIIFPMITMHDASQGIWGDFEEAMNSTAKLAKLRNLSVLNGPLVPPNSLIDEEQCKSSPELRELSYRRYLEHLDQFADAVLQKLATARNATSTSVLPVLAFSTGSFAWQYEEGLNRAAEIPPTFYIPVRQNSTFDSSKITGMRVDSKEMNYRMDSWTIEWQ